MKVKLKMTSEETFPRPGIIAADDEENTDDMSELARATLDDIFYNIIHDLVLQTHREEKIARASSAAILIEQKASECDPNSSDDPSSAAGRESHKVETPAALYEDGKVYIKSNPLKTTTEIRCQKCGLLRLLHPTDGNGAQKPEPGIEYCKKRPFIDKAYHDIYGQTFVPEGPGRGKKKKDMVNPLKAQQTKEGTPTGSQDSPAPSPPPAEGPPKPIPYPSAKCHNCGTFLPIKRMNNHMARCIGGGGRDSSRNALKKIQNGNANGGSQNGTTPPSSRNGTPVPGGNSLYKRSPTKRDAGELDFDSDSSPQKKKKVKKGAAANRLKAPKMAKSNSLKGGAQEPSNLSFEQKVEDSEEDDGGDDGDAEYGTVVVQAGKRKNGVAKREGKGEGSKKKWLLGKGGSKPILPPIQPPDVAKVKKNREVEEDSSQTLSSPN